ncbi:MAG: class I SAM-dependent DNA methyltransferase [Sulfurifustis sp.]
MTTKAAGALRLGANDFRALFDQLGPSLGFWRAAEIAALRTQTYKRPVLDLGCGDGLVMSYVLPRVDIGVDPSADAIARASPRALYGRLEAKPIEALTLAPGSVGTIVSNSVLEHVANLQAVLTACARLLRPGGSLIFTTPTDAFSRWLAVPWQGYRDWRNGHYDHRNLWPLERWHAELDRAGFTFASVRPYLRREFVLAWDALELAQRVWIGRRRLFSLGWRRLPPAWLDRLAQRAACIDLAAPAPGGGQLIVARRR